MSSITEQQNQPPLAGPPKRATTDWRDDDLTLLRKRWRAGSSARDIAEALGGRFSRNAVIGKANRLGLSRHDKPRTPAPDRKRKPVEPAPKGERRTRFRPPQPIADAQVASLEQLDTPTDGIGVSLDQLTNETCRWPKGTPGDALFVFCGCTGADFRNGKPYCGPHDRRAHL